MWPEPKVTAHRQQMAKLYTELKPRKVLRGEERKIEQELGRLDPKPKRKQSKPHGHPPQS